jgi:hypothetical protein
MQEVCDRSGLADYYFSKALHASTPSGRQANWRTLQDIVDALFPEGYDVVIKPKTGISRAAAMQDQIRSRGSQSQIAARTDVRARQERCKGATRKLPGHDARAARGGGREGQEDTTRNHLAARPGQQAAHEQAGRTLGGQRGTPQDAPRKSETAQALKRA